MTMMAIPNQYIQSFADSVKQTLNRQLMVYVYTVN